MEMKSLCYPQGNINWFYSTEYKNQYNMKNSTFEKNYQNQYITEPNINEEKTQKQFSQNVIKKIPEIYSNSSISNSLNNKIPFHTKMERSGFWNSISTFSNKNYNQEHSTTYSDFYQNIPFSVERFSKINKELIGKKE